MERDDRQKDQFTEIGLLIFNNSPYIIYLFKLDGTIFDCNKKAEEWVGYTRSELIGKNYLELSAIPPELLPKMMERFKRIAQGISPEPFDMQIHKKDGSLAWINSYISFFILENEQYFMALIQDITEKKKSEQKLKDSEEKYKNLSNEFELMLDYFPGLIFSKDTKNNFVHVNQKVVESYNSNLKREQQLLTKKDLEGRSMFDILPRDIAQTYLDDDLKVINSGLPKLFIEESWETESGINWLSTSKIPFKDEKGNIIGIIGVSTDITARKNAEQKLQESKEQYQRAYEHETFYKDLFTHDINNILQSILTSLEIINLQMGSVEDPHNIKPILKIINEQIYRGTSLVNNVYKFSQLEEAEINIQKKDVEKTILEAINYVKKNFKNKEISIQFESPKKKIYIQADELLKDVFENILINAVKHNDNPNIEIVINISKFQEDGILFWQIEFIDNGKGIPEAKRKSIFTRGFKEDRSVSGMGLGLSLVKTITVKYNAKILVESRFPEDYSKGTNIKLLFPEVV
ncbi:MAG: PAS domain-containing sensor histidine kinase [Candidatus Lokiarchaeota archaeon]|nr:PAS domain-containing sensor histidine kinase [Candidatus Lokiarchaeota archaeon]